MKPTQIIITAILLLAVTSTHAQKMRNKINGKLPAARTINEYQLSKERTLVKSYEKRTETFPRDIRYPGEFEESQAVFISWSYDYDDDGNVTGADVSSQYALVSARLADAIQKVVPVWIRVENASDTTAILSYMFNRGTPLTNYLFIISPGDDWWTRDFGPNGVYVGRQDSLAFIDLKYYDGRDKDNVAPTVLSNLLQVNNYTTRLNAEGGNFMSDGFGTIFYSDVVSDVNTDPQIVNPVFTLQEIKDKLTAIFGSTNNVELPTLLCDGGTGHIDLYLKMIDEQTLMVSKYPDEITAQDKRIIEDNYQYLTTLRSTYNRPFRIYRIPHPTDDNGNHSKKSCSQLNSDARTFVNGTTVNNTFIFPSYSNAGTGNKTQTDSVTKLFKQIMPGYKIVDIDSRLLSPLGGEIHCITMQIPADNPVLFWHPSVDGFQPIFKNTFPIVAKITNKSGIANAKCYWRIKGNSSFNEIVLRDSSDFFVGEIVANGISNSDVIEYYLSATTNNGKTATKPITAPDGYYSIFFSLNTALNEVAIFPKNYLFNAYPNPAKDKIIIPFNALNKADFTITITDILGKVVQTINPIDVKEGLNELILDVEQFNNGIYFYNLSVNHTILDTRKFIINK
ncbi:MAG: agmatine deiminase family protein [Bacteroidia bacterium]|nr:agmatine deiminase family protein [Bacteroidia bacterium]MCZ2141355.1 agmatine deiminase family protein [Bacteroidia bacterium]